MRKNVSVVQILLPLFDNEGRPFPASAFIQERNDLAQLFGGLTAFTRAPAQGLWEDEGVLKRDDIVVFEVVVENLDDEWWSDYRKGLEHRFRQDSILIRSIPAIIL
jgi:hypothetical protein